MNTGHETGRSRDISASRPVCLVSPWADAWPDATAALRMATVLPWGALLSLSFPIRSWPVTRPREIQSFEELEIIRYSGYVSLVVRHPRYVSPVLRVFAHILFPRPLWRWIRRTQIRIFLAPRIRGNKGSEKKKKKKTGRIPSEPLKEAGKRRKKRKKERSRPPGFRQERRRRHGLGALGSPSASRPRGANLHSPLKKCRGITPRG